MDPFKRATLLMTQEVSGQITSDEFRTEAKNLIQAMKADPESQPDKATPAQDQPPQGYQPPNY